ncbi:ATP-dependent RecD-like DNA helicase [Mucilaginibacter sp. OK098]|uniref:ATP-dependent DNA helicase n=1 Tax=Mucilaginibacter sp. OK098 TaxID=1855297 RepID=UPI000913BA1B|nr:ATP-dependent RecD-like DNA helicase [Mucilaginibacter sp. OK098]SHN26056.1 ATP-dependent exoDNAse (exonuclease V), alpha subunit, helicase superfamily I [Mucilaginibacter sp. OK098]
MHLTVRMAWHDNKWNGKVCCDPAANTYCTGVHSLLSGRIEKRKDTEYEQKDGVRDQYIAGNFAAAEVPPCYWSINAFSDQDVPVEHQHAFQWVEQTIPEVLRKYSVVTWPFRLSFVHGTEEKRLHGNYWPDLDQRIDNYIKKFTPKQSILFFYANYDNPVSGDDMKYLVIGCSMIRQVPTPLHFDFEPEDLREIRKIKRKKVGNSWVDNNNMKNFPTMNWMLQFSHDPETAIQLPYHEYLTHIENNPDNQHFLDDIKVVADEPSLIKGFKYVSMDIDDDKCLYLLYKIRKSIKKIQEHKQAIVNTDYSIEEGRINKLIKSVWDKRGIYPSLNHVFNHYFDNEELSSELANIIENNATNENHLLKILEGLLNEDIPNYLMPFEDSLLDLIEKRHFKKNIKSLAKLSLFILTPNQINRIIENADLLKEIAINPYILYEDYEAGEDDLNNPDMQDEPIDIFKIDIGMIPDVNFVRRHRKMQNLTEDSPERLRSVILNYLFDIGQAGHCYSSAQEVLENLYENPLIYKNGITLDNNAILNIDDDYKSHFENKLSLYEESKKEKFYYRKVVREAEHQIEEAFTNLIARPAHKISNIDIDQHINDSLAELKNTITTEEHKEKFRSERKQLYVNIFEKSFFLLTGRPGAGKTYETSKIIEHLTNQNEEIIVLAPTGKAALRLTENIRKYTELTNVEAKTIDSFIFEKKFAYLYEDWDECFVVPEDKKIIVENLVIDESSMIDLNKLSILFSIINFDKKHLKRIILVGDENQLPPIGLGKPFHDTINHIKAVPELAINHYIKLISNCRQENDETILGLAEAFAEKNKYYEQSFNKIEGSDGQKSDGLFVYRWANGEALFEKIRAAMDIIFGYEVDDHQDYDDFEKLNLLFGLYNSGWVNNQDGGFKQTLQIERLQVLTPYRTDYYGTSGLNQLFQDSYRRKNKKESYNFVFHNAEKIIRLNNWYTGWGDNRKLKLSNGSMGIVNVKTSIIPEERKYHFRDNDWPMKSVDDEENFDLAYAITVHKSQGSDFRNVFMVIPKKAALLNKELLYTALTRSKFRLFIFLQDTKENLLMKAKNTSQLLQRKTSVFRRPENKVGKYSPEPGVNVSSKIELIIYEALKRHNMAFKYEQELQLSSYSFKIHPDFTIRLNTGVTIYWEHLGMLDLRDYYNDWQGRRRAFDKDNLTEFLITTDDLNGVDLQLLDQVIEDIKHKSLKSTLGNRFSNHHYELK